MNSTLFIDGSGPLGERGAGLGARRHLQGRDRPGGEPPRVDAASGGTAAAVPTSSIRGNRKSKGLAPGIEVVLDVLLPEEETSTFRQNSTQVNFVIRGRGETEIGGQRRATALHDVWNTPSMQTYRHRNAGDDVYVRLTYSNGALLDMMNIHVVEENPQPVLRTVDGSQPHPETDSGRRTSPFGTFPLNDEGAWLMPYEKLINPPPIESPALYWPWAQVKVHLDKLEALGKDYIGRRLYLLYNPMTGRTNGTTPNFFATMTVSAAKHR